MRTLQLHNQKYPHHLQHTLILGSCLGASLLAACGQSLLHSPPDRVAFSGNYLISFEAVRCIEQTSDFSSQTLLLFELIAVYQH